MYGACNTKMKRTYSTYASFLDILESLGEPPIYSLGSAEIKATNDRIICELLLGILLTDPSSLVYIRLQPKLAVLLGRAQL